MGDPLSDDRAIWLLKSQPGEVSSLATRFHRVASQAETAASGLRGAEHDAAWTGAAADAFRHQLGKLPGDLDRVQRSYGGVASVLDAYESELAPLRSRFKQLATQIAGARGALMSAQSTLDSADQSWKAAAGAPHATPTSPAVTAAASHYNAASGVVRSLQGDVSGLEAAAYRVLDEFATARDRAHLGIRQAGGMAPHESWLSGLFHAVTNFVAGAVVNIGKSVWGLVSGQAIMAFIRDPSWRTFGTLVKDVAVTASLVALVVAPFAAPELAEADALVAGGEGAAGEGGATAFGLAMRGVTTWGSRVSTGATGGGAVSDGAQGHWGAAGLDAAFLVAPNAIGKVPTSIDAVRGVGDVVANLFRVGDRQAQAAAEASAAMRSGGRNFLTLRSWGLNPAASASLAFPPGTFANVERANWSTVRSAITQSDANALTAANRAMHIGRPLANGFDSLVTDPTHEALGRKLHLTPCEG